MQEMVSIIIILMNTVNKSNLSSVLSVHEDTNTVNTSNDVPIESLKHVENDDLTIIQTSKSITSFIHCNNFISSLKSQIMRTVMKGYIMRFSFQTFHTHLYTYWINVCG